MSGIRRTHFKVEKLPEEARKFVDEELTKVANKLTLDGIRLEIKARWGIEIAISSLSRYSRCFEHQKEKMVYLMGQAEKIMESLDGSGVELGEMAQAMVVADITYILAQGGADAENLNAFGRTLALLGRAAAQQAQAKVKYGKVFRAFERRILERLKNEVAADPELLKKLEAAIADEAAKAAEAA